MIGKVNDLVEVVRHEADGAPLMKIGSIGIIREMSRHDYYKINWVKGSPNPATRADGIEWVWHPDRFNVITHGRNT